MSVNPTSSKPHTADRTRIGMLWGDFPWTQPPTKLNKLLSVGAVARTVTHCLNNLGTVIPYMPPTEASLDHKRAELAAFLQSIDLLWADVYPATEPALRLRKELQLDCPVLLFAGGAMPKGAEAMLFPWQQLLTPDDHLIFTCEADRQIWQMLVGSSTLYEWVIPLGVDDTVFMPHPPSARTAVRAQHKLPPTAPLLLYVGRLNIQKNLHSLLRLLAAVRAVIPDVHLCLAGEEDDIVLGEFIVSNRGYVAWLHELAGELGVADAVTFAGTLFGEDLARLYAAADVLVNLSIYHRENFGMAQAEAQACGTPVVCTAWGGFKDVVRPGETGYLVDAVMTKHGIRVDWATGADCVLRLLENPDLRTRMGANASAWARQQFCLTAFTQALAPIVATCSARESRPFSTQMAYEPSAFAHLYDAHKRACGWYDLPAPPVMDGTADGADQERPPSWYPPMFQGMDYALYETLFAPYATRQAVRLLLRTIQPTWVPYIVSDLELDPVRQAVYDRDPIWPHRYFPSPLHEHRETELLEWQLLQRVDGAMTVEELTKTLAERQRDDMEVRTALWRLHVEGILMFQMGRTESKVVEHTTNDRGFAEPSSEIANSV